MSPASQLVAYVLTTASLHSQRVWFYELKPRDGPGSCLPISLASHAMLADSLEAHMTVYEHYSAEDGSGGLSTSVRAYFLIDETQHPPHLTAALEAAGFTVLVSPEERGSGRWPRRKATQVGSRAKPASHQMANTAIEIDRYQHWRK